MQTRYLFFFPSFFALVNFSIFLVAKKKKEKKYLSNLQNATISSLL